MAWDFSTEPDFQAKLDWVEDFCREEIEPLDFVFPYAVRSPDPGSRPTCAVCSSRSRTRGCGRSSSTKSWAAPVSVSSSWRY